MSIRLSAAAVSVGIDPAAGGRLSSLVVAGRERLITREDPAAVLPAVSWGSFVMVPWVGRLRFGRLRWRGRTADLAPNFGVHAIHGVAFDVPWQVIEASEADVTLRCTLGPSGSWPFDSTAIQVVTVTPEALEQRVEVRSAEPMPVAVGWHPWFRRDRGEPMRVAVPAAQVLETTEGPIPTGLAVPVGAETDLRTGPELGDRRLDHAFVEVSGPCLVSWDDLELAIDAHPLRSVVVHSPAAAVCVEPQTAWPDAIRLDGEGFDAGLAVVEPDQPFAAWTRWSWRAPGR